MPRITYVPEATAATPDFPASDYAPTWERNPSWLALPTVTAVEQKVVLLASLRLSGSNNIGVSCAGAFTVDWGDGSAPSDHTSGSNAVHDYDEADAQFDDTCAPVVLNATDDTVERTGHGYVDGDRVSLYSIVTTTGIMEGAEYYVVNAAPNDFQLALTENGTPLALTGDGTAALLPYKQVILTVTPQAAQNLTSITLTGSAASYGPSPGAPWLEAVISAPNATALSFPACTYIEHVNILSFGSLTSAASLFTSAHNLRKVQFPSGWGASLTSTAAMFNNCTRLIEVGLFTASAVTNTSNMFSGCYSLYTLPDFVFSGAITNASSMFAECTKLQDLSNVVLNLASCTNGQSMFSNCLMLASLPPILNVSAMTNASYMFYSCTRLTEVPALAFTGTNVDIGNTFGQTWALERITELDLSGASSAQQAFTYSGIRELPALDLGAVTGSLASMFNFARALKSITISDIGTPTSLSSMFSSSGVEWVDIQGGSLAAVTTASSMFSQANSLRRVTMPSDFDVTLTNTSDMFSSCTSLTEIPFFNTEGVTNASGMFTNCYALRSIPEFDLSAATNIGNLFYGCRVLRSVPSLDLSAATTASGVFQQCGSLWEIPAFAFTAATTFSNMFNTCPSIYRILATDFNFSFSIQNCCLDAAALDELYTNLPVVVGQTITVTGNPGTSADDPTIATAKGWTVTG